MLLDTLPETHLDGISTLPECTKEIEYMTEGSVISRDEDDIFIRYGNDDSPMCVHIRKDGSVTLSGEESDLRVGTDDITNNMTEKGGSLTVSYSIEVNGIVAEVTDFTITADKFTSPVQF